MKKYNYNLDKVKQAVANNITYTGVMNDLGIPVKGGNHKTIKQFIQRNGIDTSHFDQYRSVSRSEYIPVATYFGSKKRVKSAIFLKKLISEGYKIPKCEVCGITEWNGKNITFQLHHKDGDATNNSLENVQVICPNCHSQTDNFKGWANKSNKEKHRCSVCGKELRTKAKTGMCQVCARRARR